MAFKQIASFMNNSHKQGNPVVSVLIPAYNVQDVIEHSIRSVLAQSLRDTEVIVVDDASTDATAQMTRQLMLTDPRIRLLEATTNGGPGLARAKGLSEARGKWISILDADDSFAPDRLERLVGIAEANALDAIADNIWLIDPGTLEAVAVAFPIQAGQHLSLTPTRFIRNAVPAGRINMGWCQPMVRHSFLRENKISWRPFRHAEDFLFAMEMLLAGAQFTIIGDPGYLYTQRLGSKSNTTSPHSRTERSVTEQHAVLDDLLLRNQAKITPQLRASLSTMRRQIEVAGHLQDFRDALANRDLGRVTRALSAAAQKPRILLTCTLARYGPRSGSIAQ
jgi:succinoglycan biosynthesis protein ExoO